MAPVYPFWTAALPSVGLADTVVFAVFFLGAMSCFGASSFFHTSLCHTKEVRDPAPPPRTCLGDAHPADRLACPPLPRHTQVVALTRRVDFLGIFLMGNACFVPSFHYGFFCDPSLRNFYAGTMTAACLSGIYVVCLSDAFQTPEFRRLRTATFVVVGSTSVFPFAHAVLKYGVSWSRPAGSTLWILVLTWVCEQWTEASASMGFGWIAVEMAC